MLPHSEKTSPSPYQITNDTRIRRTRDTSDLGDKSIYSNSGPHSGNGLYLRPFRIPPQSDDGLLPTVTSAARTSYRSKFSPWPPQRVISPTLRRRRHLKALAVVSFLAAILLIHDVDNVRGRNRLHTTASIFGGSARPGYFSRSSSIISSSKWHWAAVSDLDRLSRMPNSESDPTFYSILQSGTLSRNEDGKYEMDFAKETRTLTGKHNEGGRGMELSELVTFQNRLLTFDDRTGAIFELLSSHSDSGGEEHATTVAIPRLVVTEGDGDTMKGMKVEWATAKDGNLVIGSDGKEHILPDGSIYRNHLWVVILGPSGDFRREDWTKKYQFVSDALLGPSGPGYITHEAVGWSEFLQKWVFFPRRVSLGRYDAIADERRGSNIALLVNENFTSSTEVKVKFKSSDQLRGFSSVSFVPGTRDQHVLAVRSVEQGCAKSGTGGCLQRSYGTVFDLLSGDVLMDDKLFPLNYKFEGIEFVKIDAPVSQK